MIPKTIHYCWFGRNPLPKLARKCIKSWKKYCPDYEIIEWNEDNYDLASAPLYVQQAYEAKKWAFVSDYVRLQVVYEHGGIYLDTDVELIKRLDSLLEYNAYFGFEDGKYVATGLGFGAVAGNSVVSEMMHDYDNVPFINEDGTYDMLPCPQRNTKALIFRGLIQDDSWQVLDGNVLIMPSIYLCPMVYETQTIRRSKDTISIHWFTSFWLTEQQRANRKRNAKAIITANRMHNVLHIPNRIVRSILGNDRYEKLKRLLKRG